MADWPQTGVDQPDRTFVGWSTTNTPTSLPFHATNGILNTRSAFCFHQAIFLGYLNGEGSIAQR